MKGKRKQIYEAIAINKINKKVNKLKSKRRGK